MLPPDLVAKLNECAQTNFAGAKDLWFSRQSWFSIAVIVGLVLEGPELRYDILSIVRSRIRRFRYRIVLVESRIELAKAAAFVGWIFIIGGLLGELRAASKIEDLSASIQGCSDAKVREATLEAGDAQTSAQIAKAAAKVATEQSNKAVDRASYALRLANETIEIEETHAWRKLSDRQISEIGQALKTFAGRSASLTYPQGDVEAAYFTGQMRLALRAAEWHDLLSCSQIDMQCSGPEPSPSQPVPTMPPPTGVLVVYKFEIHLHPLENVQRGKAANALASELTLPETPLKVSDSRPS